MRFSRKFRSGTYPNGTGPTTRRQRSRYRELSPPSSLCNHVVCLWTQDVEEEGAEYVQPILPDGCVDIVWINAAPPIIAGPATQRILFTLRAGAHVLGARLRPGHAARVLGTPVDELLNQHVALTDIWGSKTRRSLATSRLHHVSTVERLRAATSELAVHVSHIPSTDPLFRHSISWLASHSAGTVRDLAIALDTSERHLRRRFQREVGYGPKMFQRIVRFQRLLAMAANGASKGRDLSGLAYIAGYSDQAHMCREVRELSGQSPRALLPDCSSTLSMSDLFNTEAAYIT